MSDFNLIPVLPEIFLALVAMGLLIVGAFRGNDSTPVISWACIYGMALSILVLFGLEWDREIVLGGMFVFDKFGGFLKLLILIGLIAVLAMSVRNLEKEGMSRFEYPILVVLAGIGMMMMVSAHNMLSLYMGLELQSLSLYVLAAFKRNSVRSSESGIKYFILGALSSGFLLFGISLIYGFTGSLDFSVIESTLSSEPQTSFGAIFGLVFILAGLAFKISAVPFHMWTPDVYQGAPTSVTALFAIVPKLAAMGLLVRLLYGPFGPLVGEWQQIIIFLSVASMLVGAFAAIVQSNIKRLLAYSSIGHMGYGLIGLAVGTELGAGALILYMLIYMVMSAGVFAIVLQMRRGGLETGRIDDLAGLSQTHPMMAYALAILMFSMAGIPPMAGFFGKLIVFQAAVEAEFYILAVLGVLTSVVAAFYYLKIIKVMFFEDPADPFEKEPGFAIRTVLLVSVLFVVGFIFRPSVFMSSALDSVSILFGS